MEKATVIIEELAEELEMASSNWMQFLKTTTGEVISISEDSDFRNDEDDELLEEIDCSNEYLRLPSQYELHEYRIMERFAAEMEDIRVQQELFSALRRNRPYRRFKDTVNFFGIQETYYAYRFVAFCRIARDWCEAYEVPYTYRGEET